MFKGLLRNIKESSLSIMPITVAVFLLYATGLIPMNGAIIVRTIISMVMLILGIMLFSVGTSHGFQQIGELIASNLTKRRKIFLLAAVIFILGFLVTMAEPSVTILGAQIPSIDNTVFSSAVALGIGVFITLAVIRIIFQWRQGTLYLLFYFIIFGLMIFMEFTSFLPIAFDASGATTGLLTVPLFMAFGTGVANSRGGNKAHEDSFGLLGMASVGPIITVIVFGLFAKQGLSYQNVDPTGLPYEGLTTAETATQLAKAYGESAFFNFWTSALIIIPVSVFFFIYQLIYIKLPRRRISQIMIALLFTLIGLILFLTGADVGYVGLGQLAGEELVKSAAPGLLLLIGFILGAVNAIAEPAVHVLAKQVETVSNGTISFKTMLVTLSLGLGISVFLSILRIQLKLPVVYFLFPGYIIALSLAQIVPNIYIAVAFDSGGAVSGPMTSSFITPLITGIALATFRDTMPNWQSEVVLYAFGSIGLVAMMPLITIQLLGFSSMVQENYRRKVALARIYEADDAQIIYFEEVN